LHRELTSFMIEDPHTITRALNLMSVAHNLERIGDHATNIAETTYFLVTGAQLTEERPKGDMSSTTAIIEHKT
jgi:phosphate transport system protein